jgi:3-oxoadipate enol-lactonase
MATARINGIDIHFEDTGGDEPAVLFSHGFLMDHTMFDAQVEALADRYRCVRWDERGFGGTTADGPFTYWDSADDAVGLLDHLGIDRAVFVGMSQGGFLSLRAALSHPDRVRALVLIDSAADVDDDETIEGYRGMLHVFEHGSDADRAGVFDIVAGLILGDESLAAEWIPRWMAIERAQLVAAGEALLGRDDVSGRVGEITCPMLTVHGTADQAISIARAELLAASAVDHRGIVRVDGAAHAPNMTHPDAVNPPLAAFLASL